jgi:hypothetical protein
VNKGVDVPVTQLLSFISQGTFKFGERRCVSGGHVCLATKLEAPAFAVRY